MIKLYDVQKIYTTLSGGHHVLKDINLYFEKGEFVSILGRSGCGKTTLLNLIGCLDTPSSGQISIDDKLISKMKTEELDEFRNHRIGIIFQNYNLINHLNVLENVMLSLDINGKVEERREKSLEILRRVGLEKHTHKLVNQLSGGQKQRVAIARALVGNPDLILADEPTGALDSKTGKEVMDLIKELCADKLVILVTHNKKIAEEYSTRILEMKDGRIVSDTNPTDQRVKLDLDKKLIMNKMGFKSAIKYSFKSAIKNKGKTLLLSIGLALGITIIALIDGIFNGARNKISDRYLLENNQILYGYTDHIEDYEDVINKIKDMEGVSDAYEAPTELDVKQFNGDELFNYNINTVLASPIDVALKNEFNDAILYGRMPENDKEIAISYTHFYSLIANNALTEIEMSKYVLDKEIVVQESFFYHNVELTEEGTLYYEELADEYSNDNTNTLCIRFDYSRFGETGEFYTPDNESLANILDSNLYNNIKTKVRVDGIMYNSNNVGYFTMDYSMYEKNILNKNYTLKITGIFEQGLGDLAVSDVVKTMEYNGDKTNNIYIIIDSDSISRKVDIVKSFQDMGVYAYDLHYKPVSNSTSSFVINLLQFVFTTISSVTLLTAAVMLWLLIHVNVTQRKREIGLLRSMGATKNDVKGVFVGEAAVIGVFACLISLVLVVAITLFANWFIPHHAYEWFTENFSILNGNKPFIINVKKLLIIFGIGILISILAGLIPSSRAGKKKPIESLRGE